MYSILSNDRQSSYAALEIKLKSPLNKKNEIEIRQQYFIKTNNNGNPEPKNDRSIT